MPGSPAAVLETSLYVDDLQAAEQFYCDVLGLTFDSRQPDRHVFLRCGAQMLLLFDPQATASPDSTLPRHGTHGAGHIAFAVRQDELDQWQERLEQHGVTVEKIVRWPEGVTSLYFRDPAGNSVELVSPRLWRLPEVE